MDAYQTSIVLRRYKATRKQTLTPLWFRMSAEKMTSVNVRRRDLRIATLQHFKIWHHTWVTRLGDLLNTSNSCSGRFRPVKPSSSSNASNTTGENTPTNPSSSANQSIYQSSHCSLGLKPQQQHQCVHNADKQEDKYQRYNCRAARKLILHYYNKQESFSG